MSLVSVWEIQIKQQSGKLGLKTSLANLLIEQERNGLQLLDITTAHILALSELPDHRRDPFDRLLIARARTEGLTLITQDSTVSRYPVSIIW